MNTKHYKQRLEDFNMLERVIFTSNDNCREMSTPSAPCTLYPK